MSGNELDSTSYKQIKTLSSEHTDSITFMQFSPCGRYLVTGGDDLRMNVFDCADGFKRLLNVNSTCAASAVCWDPTRLEACFVGYSSGAVAHHVIGHNPKEWAAEVSLFHGCSRVVSLAWNKLLAIATERNVSLIKDIKAKIEDGGIIDIPPPASTGKRPETRSLCFAPDGSLVIAYLEHGLACWTPNGKTLKWTFKPRTLRIGRFSYSPSSDLFIIHNLYDGFDAYHMRNRVHFRSYRFPASRENNVPLACLLIDGGESLLCGTTFGRAVVLDAKTVAHKQDLLHCESGLVQEIAYSSVNNINLLATTATEQGKDTTIKIWSSHGIPSRPVGYADYAAEALRSGIEFIGSLYADCLRWRHQKIEISIFSLILLGVGLLLATWVAFYSSATNVREFGPVLRSSYTSSVAFLDRTIALFRMRSQLLLRSGVKICYASLNGIAFALKQFLDEEPTLQSSGNEATLAAIGAGAMHGDILDGATADSLGVLMVDTAEIRIADPLEIREAGGVVDSTDIQVYGGADDGQALVCSKEVNTDDEDVDIVGPGCLVP